MGKENKKPSIFRRFYNWFMAWAEKPTAEKALAGFTFIEAIFFPIPPDPLLMAMVFNKPKRWVRYATITLIATIIGGVVGYLAGIGLFETLGEWIVETYHLQEEYDALGRSFQDNDFIAVLTAAMTPIPYKIITLSAGAFDVNFISFLVASVIGRGARFFGVAYLAKWLGVKYKDRIEKYIDAISIGILILVVLAILLIT
jgi:membrane protein YqaA with SNARE-associated domain